MNKLLKYIKALFIKKDKQEQLIEFVLDEKTIDRAAKGSMDKREALLRRVARQQG